MFPKYELRNTAIYISNQSSSRYPTRFHKQVEILCVKKGSIDVTIDGQSYTLNDGDIYIVFPNILHSIDSGRASSTVLVADDDYFISFHETLSRYKPTVPILRAGEFPEIVYTLLNRAVELRKSNVKYKSNMLVGYFASALGELLNYLKLVERSADTDLVQQFILYILDNYTKDITLDNVAHDLNYNKFYISHIVSETFKCNFRSLINSYRIGMAQNLLLSSEKTINEIAYECGFKNQSSFNRIFLEVSGITPSAFRRSPENAPEKPMVYEKIIDNTTGMCYNRSSEKSDDREK